MPEAKVAFLTGLPEAIVDVVTSYNPEGFTTRVVDGRQPEEEQIEAVKDADFIMVYRAALSDAVLRAAPGTRIVQLLAAGYDSMNLKLMRELEIPCCNNGGANSRAVADHAVLLMLSLYKRLVESDKAVRADRWGAPIDGSNTFEMADKMVGILGFGNIGKRVARRVQGFEANVQYFDKYGLSQAEESELGITGVSLEELFSTSDIVTCHTRCAKIFRCNFFFDEIDFFQDTVQSFSHGRVFSVAAIRRIFYILNLRIQTFVFFFQ